ncbi:hypothetical protein LOAG_00975 [Loa loa]|uniref:Uncharacterized protein n=1 Tax=Loa loa TaxID=7209 RepID=A0A1S0UA30_LOALO|nr:hypothetical protein LOAG_00975 [Loa loa]EFO27511.1 hypothetical protein LOAG_00975 [Loa loa]
MEGWRMLSVWMESMMNGLQKRRVMNGLQKRRGLERERERERGKKLFAGAAKRRLAFCVDLGREKENYSTHPDLILSTGEPKPIYRWINNLNWKCDAIPATCNPLRDFLDLVSANENEQLSLREKFQAQPQASRRLGAKKIKI